MMLVPQGATDVTTYFHLRLAATGLDATGLTITNFDLQYVRSRVAPAAKVDATALAATDSAHADNQAIEIDATDQPGVYRVDWPDAAFASGVDEVILTVKCATAFTESLRVRLLSVTRGLAGTALPAVAADAAGGLPVSDAGGLDLDAKLANTNEVTTARMGALTDWINGGRLDLLLDAIKAVTDLLPDGGALTSLGAEIDDILAALSMHSGTAQAGAAGTITLDTGASSVNDYYNDALVLIRSGTGVGQVRHISDYVGATRVATIKPNWITTPDNTSVFRVLPETSHWDHVLVDHQDAGSMGETAQAILLDTAEIGTAGAGLTNIDLPNQTMNITGNITGNLSGSVGSVTGAVGSVTAGVTLAASAVQAIWDALTSALTTVGSIGKSLVDNFAAILARISPIVTKTGAVVADGGNSATTFVTDLTETTNDYWKDSFLRLTSGVLINQVKKITAYNGTTKAITVLGGFTGTPAASVNFEIVND